MAARRLTIGHGDYIDALAAMGFTDTRLVSLEIKAGVVTVVRHSVDSNGAILVGCYETWEYDIAEARPA
jgi:hypothetical protein